MEVEGDSSHIRSQVEGNTAAVVGILQVEGRMASVLEEELHIPSEGIQDRPSLVVGQPSPVAEQQPVPH